MKASNPLILSSDFFLLSFTCRGIWSSSWFPNSVRIRWMYLLSIGPKSWIPLTSKCCAPESLMDECMAMATMICETGPIAIQQAKYAINYGLVTDLHTGLAIESNAYWVTLPSENRLEGLAAFRQKRKPVYKSK